MDGYDALVLARHQRRQAERYDELAAKADSPDVRQFWTILAAGARHDAETISPKENAR